MPLITLHLPMDEKALHAIIREASFCWRKAVMVRHEDTITFENPEADPEAASMEAAELGETLDIFTRLLVNRRIQEVLQDPEKPGHLLLHMTPNKQGIAATLRLGPQFLTNGRVSVTAVPLPPQEPPPPETSA